MRRVCARVRRVVDGERGSGLKCDNGKALMSEMMMEEMKRLVIRDREGKQKLTVEDEVHLGKAKKDLAI